MSSTQDAAPVAKMSLSLEDDDDHHESKDVKDVKDAKSGKDGKEDKDAKMESGQAESALSLDDAALAGRNQMDVVRVSICDVWCNRHLEADVQGWQVV